MRQEKTFIEQELERERNSGRVRSSWWDRIRRLFITEPGFKFTDWDEVERIRAEKRRDAIEVELAKARGAFVDYGVTVDEFNEAIHKAVTDQNRLTEYVWDTITDEPSVAGTVMLRKLSDENAASHARAQALIYDRAFRDAIKQMQKHGG